jgi:tetratricopeptide (TPR) repeat protein
LNRSLVRVLIPALLCAACATRDAQTWFTYQVAGETAALHARYQKAEDYLARARAEAFEPRQRARNHLAYARLARDLDDLPRARAELAEAQREAEALPPDAPERVRVALEAAWIELAGGSPQTAADAFAKVEAESLERFGEAEPLTGYAAAGRGEALRRAGDVAGARKALETALTRFRGTASADHVKPSEPLGIVMAALSLAKIEAASGQLEVARTALRASASLAGEEMGTDHPRLAEVLSALADVELALGDRTAARRAADRAVAIADGRLPAGHPIRVEATAAQARCAAS